ncbi:MAG: hypothetical protein E6767_12105 [Dysgonomonas sp.]|nr:hypothetical protein [Dysgonomonas sp.]
MLKIDFNNHKFNVPASWQDVKLGDYEKWFMNIPQDKAGYIHFVADICHIDPDLVLNSPTELFDALTEATSFLNNTDFDPSDKIVIDGKDYFASFYDKLTLGEWIDIEETLTGDSQTKISELLAIVCRPLHEEYDTDIIADRKELFRNLSCDKVMPLVAFFLHKKKESDAILSHYSAVVAQANRFLKDTKTFVVNGDGIKLLPIWQRIRYTYLIRLLEKQLSKFSGFSSIG